MRCRIHRKDGLICAALLAYAILAGAAAELQPVPDPDLIGIGSGRIDILESRPDWDANGRSWVSRHPLYFDLWLGDANVACHGVVDESSGDGSGHDAVYIDTDGDGDLVDESLKRPVREETGRTVSLRTDPIRVAVTYRDGSRRNIGVRVALSGFSDTESGEVAWSAQYQVAELMRGVVAVGAERSVEIAILDRSGAERESNACFNDYGVDRLRMDVNGDGVFDADREDFPLSKVVLIHGTAWDLSVDASARRVDVRPCALPLGSVDLKVQTCGETMPTGSVELVSDEGYAFACRLPCAEVVRMPAGEYRIARATLRIRDSERRTWVASFARTNAVSVSSEAETVVRLGRPFTLSPMTEEELKPGTSACITAHVFGVGGEEYVNVAPLKMRMKPQVRIEDAEGICVADGRMEYG